MQFWFSVGRVILQNTVDPSKQMAVHCKQSKLGGAASCSALTVLQGIDVLHGLQKE